MVPPSVLQLGQFIIVQNNMSNNGPSIRGAVKKFPEMWYTNVMVGHMTTLT